MSRDAVVAAFKQGLTAVLALFQQLIDQNVQLQNTVTELAEKIDPVWPAYRCLGGLSSPAPVIAL